MFEKKTPQSLLFYVQISISCDICKCALFTVYRTIFAKAPKKENNVDICDILPHVIYDMSYDICSTR